MILEACGEFGICGSCRSRLVDNDDIEAVKLVLTVSERLSDDALDAVSIRRLLAVLLGDGEAEPGVSACSHPVKDGKALVPAAPGLSEDPSIRSSVLESTVDSEPVAPGAVGTVRRELS